ncbi:unnamed protein product, partial [Rhizoctonia solani]
MTNRVPLSHTSASDLLSVHTTADIELNIEPPDILPLKAVERHPEFFFEDRLVTIQVEGTLFNVHQYQLTKSEVFSDMFKMPKGEGPEEGSPDHPIVIKGVAASDFTALLRVLYASHFSSSQPTLATGLIISAFRLANMWNFSELRAYLLPLAEKHLDDVDKIVFAREFDLNEWFAPAYIRLYQREQHLTIEEAKKLEVESILLISHMRERYRSGNTENRSWPFAVNGYYCSNCTGLTHAAFGSFPCQECNSSGVGRLRCDMKGTMARKAQIAPTATEPDGTANSEVVVKHPKFFFDNTLIVIQASLFLHHR